MTYRIQTLANWQLLTEKTGGRKLPDIKLQKKLTSTSFCLIINMLRKQSELQVAKNIFSSSVYRVTTTRACGR
jgi:hypothetical protein